MLHRICLLLLLPVLGFSQPTQQLRGRITDGQTGQPLVGVVVQLNQSSQAINNTTTSENGHYQLPQVAVGRYQVTAQLLGYRTENVAEVLVVSSKETVLDFILWPTTHTLDETVVKAASPNLSGAATSIQTITPEQVMRYPATFLDPARLAQGFAGVVNTDDQANGLSIRGNSPNGMQWRLEGMEIVNPNHLSNAGTFSDQPTNTAGGVNMLSAQLLGNMNFLSGAFPAEYGNATSGVMDMRLRKGSLQPAYTVQAGLLGIDVAAEGPMGKNGATYLANYRYSFTGLLGLMGIDFGGERIAFQDLAFHITQPTKRGELRLFGMGGLNSNVYNGIADRTQWKVEKDAKNINYAGRVGAAGLTYERTLGERTKLRTVMGVSGLENRREEYFQLYTNQLAHYWSSKSVKRLISWSSLVTHRLADKHQLKLGMDASQVYAFSGSDINPASVTGILAQPFGEWQYKPSDKWLVTTGLRYLYFTGHGQAILPRFSIAYQAKPNHRFSLAMGQQGQIPLIEQDVLHSNGLPHIKSEHFVGQYQWNINQQTYFRTEVYFQRQKNLPILVLNIPATYFDFERPSFDEMGWNLNNHRGRNYGVEFTLQKFLTDGWYTLSNVTLYRALLIDKKGVAQPSRFDGRFASNLMLGKEWSRSPAKQWGVNGRLTLMGGLRTRPIDVAASQLAKQTIFRKGEGYTGQQKTYFRPDVRVYFRKSRPKATRMWSLDLQNVANYQNEAYAYYDIVQQQVVQRYQLGLIPMLNYRLEF